jgi:hypothetical protein
MLRDRQPSQPVPASTPSPLDRTHRHHPAPPRHWGGVE